ncbi:O-antigen ligase family protein [Shewanella baltica]|jgi:O-antigen ligase|uniref:O-antigen ligase family protein n=1 Tax=Shewanella baltica TaxID=62322 RepID=UPI00217E1D83|nr:O-antigen ligase family protein [Shewanella baltica]MCS6121049.1 O-antigen ligase family protein [Shewanella baltica]MCS6154105.1 O-antigen ligase family protein [Shewanella baltica]
MKWVTYSWGVLITFICVLLLGTVFAFNFSHIVDIDNEYDIKRFLVVGFIWLSSLVLCFVKDVEFIKISTIAKICLSMFLILAMFSALASKHPFWGMVEIANIGLFIVAFYFFVTSMRSITRTTLCFVVYAGTLLFSVLTFTKYILFLFFSYTDARSFDIHGLLSGYVNVRFFNQLQAMMLPLLFLPFFNQKLAKFKRISIVFIALHWAVLLQTEARGVMLSLILAISVMLYFIDADTRKKFILTMLQTMLFGICLWLVFIIIIPYWLMDSSSFQIRTGSSGRLDLWLYVLKSIPERLWLGFGPMSFAWAEGKPLPNAHPHNSVMQLLYEYGVISCIVCTSWAMSWVYQRLQYIHQVKAIEVIPVTYALLSGLCYSLFSGIVVMPLAQLMLVFLIAMQMQTSSANTYSIGIMARIGLIFTTTIMSCLILITYKHEELLSAFFPRIWLNGLI